jgi:hypothetical protein
MTALSANRATRQREGSLIAYQVAATTHIYKGSIVAVNAAGNAVPAADTAGLRVVGIAEEEVNNTGAAGAADVQVRAGIAALLAGSGLALTDVGSIANASDDQTIVTAGTNGVKVGRIVEFVSATSVWVFIPKGGLSTGLADGTYSANEQAIINDLVG